MKTIEFIDKVFLNAPMQFLVGEMENDINDMSILSNVEIYKLIKNEAEKLTEKEMYGFIQLNC